MSGPRGRGRFSHYAEFFRKKSLWYCSHLKNKKGASLVADTSHLLAFTGSCFSETTPHVYIFAWKLPIAAPQLYATNMPPFWRNILYQGPNQFHRTWYFLNSRLYVQGISRFHMTGRFKIKLIEVRRWSVFQAGLHFILSHFIYLRSLVLSLPFIMQHTFYFRWDQTYIQLAKMSVKILLKCY
jgi:hypothetical protein